MTNVRYWAKQQLQVYHGRAAKTVGSAEYPCNHHGSGEVDVAVAVVSGSVLSREIAYLTAPEEPVVPIKVPPIGSSTEYNPYTLKHCDI